MDTESFSGATMSADPGFFEQFGTALVAGAVAFVGWVMNTFTSRHLEAMDRLTSKVGAMGEDVAAMKTDISSLRHSQDEQDRRISRLEAD